MFPLACIGHLLCENQLLATLWRHETLYCHLKEKKAKATLKENLISEGSKWFEYKVCLLVCLVAFYLEAFLKIWLGFFFFTEISKHCFEGKEHRPWLYNPINARSSKISVFRPQTWQEVFRITRVWSVSDWINSIYQLLRSCDRVARRFGPWWRLTWSRQHSNGGCRGGSSSGRLVRSSFNGLSLQETRLYDRQKFLSGSSDQKCRRAATKSAVLTMDASHQYLSAVTVR